MDEDDKLKVDWSEEAISEAEEIVKGIKADNPSAAAEFSTELVDRVTSLGRFPLRSRPGRVDGTREFIFRKRFVVVYSVHQENIIVLRVLRARQNFPA